MRRVSITSRNDTFQILCALRDNRKKRAKRDVIYIEGVAPINICVDRRIPVDSVVYAAGTRLSGWAKDTIHRLAPEIAYELSPALMAELSERNDTSELIVVARRPKLTIDALTDAVFRPSDASTPGPVFLILDRPSNHGNLGSILRSADAFAVDGVVITGHSVDMYAPAVIRSSLGACFTQRLVFEPSMRVLIDWIEGIRERTAAAGDRMQVFATDSAGTASLLDTSLAPPVMLLMGNEATGVSSKLLEIADAVLSIPVAGSVNSLNLACAASIFLYKTASESASMRTEF